MHPRVAMEPGGRLCQRIVGSEIGLPVGTHDQQAGADEVGRDVAEEQQRCRVRPVEVVEDDHRRALRRHRGQQPHHGRHERVLVAERPRFGARAGRSLLQRREQPGELADARVVEIGDGRVVGVLDVVVERLDPRQIGDGELLVAAPVQDQRAGLGGFAGEGAREPGLAETGFAGHEHDGALALPDSLEAVVQHLQLGDPTDERRRVGDREAALQRERAHARFGDPVDAQGRDRLGKALELQVADLDEDVGATRDEHPEHGVGQDLSAPGPRQSRAAWTTGSPK